MEVKIVDYVKTATQEDLEKLLQTADVCVGKWNGHHIIAPGYKGGVTYTAISKRANELFDASTQKMHSRNDYFNEASAPRKSGGIGYRISPFTPIFDTVVCGVVTVALLPWTIMGNALDWALKSTPKMPSISQDEEKLVRESIELRDKISGHLETLHQKGIEKVEEYARKSCFGKINRKYDRYLDNPDVWRFSTENSKKILEDQSLVRQKAKALLEMEKIKKEEAEKQRKEELKQTSETIKSVIQPVAMIWAVGLTALDALERHLPPAEQATEATTQVV